MKAHMLLFWVFAVPVQTIVLQPSLNVSVLHNVSVESDLFGVVRLNQSVFNTEEKQRNKDDVTVQVADSMTEIEMKGETGSDVKKQGGEEKQIQRQNLDEHDASHENQDDNEETQITDKLLLSALKNITHTKTLEDEDHLVPNAQSVIQYTTPITKTTASQSALHFQKQDVQHPSFPPATVGSTSIITNTALSSETSFATTKHHIQTTTASMQATLQMNENITNNDLTVTLHARNDSKLHLLEEESIDVTAAAARAGLTAKLTPALMTKPKNKAKPNSNTTAKAKTKKLPKRNRENAKKKTNALKKKKKMRKEKKSKPTTASYFPYFEDHYCPPECSCYGRVVQCSDKNMEKIPYGIPYNSRYILLMNNRIDRIQPKLLSLYESMEFLVLSNNRLTDAAIEDAFKGIRSLKRLHMERNSVRSVPTDLPASLEELRLDGNQVSVIPEAAMARCPNLLILSLSNNSLGNESSTVPPGVLLPVVGLRTLTLSYNRLTSVPLQLPLSLRELYLRGNLIQRLQGDMFWGKAELQVLDLSANRLTDKGLGKAALLNASRLESLNLEGNLLKHVPRHLPRTIKTLNLEGNFISSISKDAFISMPQLEHLGLARNKITKVAVGAFRVLPLLHQLDLSHNGLQQVPRQLPLWLHSATFMHNKIRTVPRDAFCWGQGKGSPLSRLVRVQLEHNMIDLGHLDTQAFRCLRGFQVVQFY